MERGTLFGGLALVLTMGCVVYLGWVWTSLPGPAQAYQDHWEHCAAISDHEARMNCEMGDFALGTQRECATLTVVPMVVPIVLLCVGWVRGRPAPSAGSVRSRPEPTEDAGPWGSPGSGPGTPNDGEE